MNTSRRSRSAPRGQSVSFVELFFDLVFVFGVTEVTSALRDSHTALEVVTAGLIFWLLWWGWSQFTWSLNAADTTHHVVQAATLSAVVLAFAMATGVTSGFNGSGWWFAAPYVALRCVGLGIYLWVAAEHEARRRAVAGFTAMSVVGMSFVLLGSTFDGGARAALWAAAVGTDLLAARRGGRRGSYDLDPPHFVERHGLFVILALGESLIAVGVSVPDAERTGPLVGAAIAGVVLVCLLWWTYFAHIKPGLEEAILDAELDPSTLARDVYSLLHFPVLCGIVAMAAAAEEAVGHPQDALPWLAVGKFAAGLVLYVVGLSVVHRRAASSWLWHRVIIAAAGCIAVIAVQPIGAMAVLWAGAGTLLAVAIWEELVFDARPLRRARAAS